MTKLDALLLELENLDKQRTPGKISPFENGAWGSRGYGVSIGDQTREWLVTDKEAINGYNAIFLATAANSNAILREIIRVQQEALKYYADGWHYQLSEGIENQTILEDGTVEMQEGDIQLENGTKAREALEKVEKLCEK